MADSATRSGILLVNLGTPASPSIRDVRRYLREFLMDGRVIDVPGPLRALLVHGAILPFRPRRSAEAYAAIWTKLGSPLLVHGRELSAALQQQLGDAFVVELGMRYGAPSISDAVERLRAAGVSRVIALPLFPQYSAAATGSARARIAVEAGRIWDPDALCLLGDFHAADFFVGAQAAIARPLLDDFGADHVLFSYHGLPARQLRRSDPTRTHCLASPDCCLALDAPVARCYRAQCLATSRALDRALNLDPAKTSSAFQSRLGRAEWIRPYTDEVLPELAARGVRRLAVLTPSFVSDCLETLEEIGLRGREQWREVGGDELLLLPCVNAHPHFVSGLADWLRAAAAGLSPAVAPANAPPA